MGIFRKPGGDVFRQIKLVLAFFEICHLGSVFAKLFSVLTSGFRGDVIVLQKYMRGTGHALWRPCFYGSNPIVINYVEGHLMTISDKLHSSNQWILTVT